MRECCRRRRVGDIVGGHVHRLHRSDRAALGRGDAFLEVAHFRAERWLVTNGAGHAAQQRGHFRTRLHEAKNVVDEQQYVLAFGIAEILGLGQRRQRHAQARARWLVHLAEHQHGVGNDARLGHFQVQIVAFAGAFADAAEGGIAAVFLGDVADQFLDQHGLAHARAAEQADLAALGKRGEQVDGFQAGLELFRGGHLLFKRRRQPVNRTASCRG